MRFNIYQRQEQQLDSYEAKHRWGQYRTDRQEMQIDWNKFDFNVENFYNNKAAFLLLCQELSVKHQDPVIRERAMQLVSIQKEKTKLDQCEKQIENIKKKLNEAYQLILIKRQRNDQVRCEYIQKENELKTIESFYEKMELIQNNEDQKLSTSKQRQRDEEIKKMKNYDSKEGVQKIKKQIIDLVKEQGEIFENIRQSFSQSYCQDEKKHDNLLQVLKQWESNKTKVISSRQEVKKKEQEYEKVSFKLAAISSQVDQQNQNIKKLKSQLDVLKNPRPSSSIQVGNSVSQIIQSNIFNQRANQVVKRQHRVVQNGYSKYINCGLCLWLFILIVIFLKDSLFAGSSNEYSS